MELKRDELTVLRKVLKMVVENPENPNEPEFPQAQDLLAKIENELYLK